MLRFKYTNLAPPASITNGKRNSNTYIVTLKWDGDDLVFERQHVSSDGAVAKYRIRQIFTNKEWSKRITTHNVAKMIHWSCCGWAVNPHQIQGLVDRVEDFLMQTPKRICSDIALKD